MDIVPYFGLSQLPFDKSIKTSRVIDTEPLRECAARLDFIKRRGGIMLLVGDPGVGKTLGLRCFTESLNPNIFRPLYTPLSTLKGTDLLRHINQRLGLPHRASKGVVYDQIQQEILESREQRGRTVVLIIDEAHLLQTRALQELRLMCNFKMDSFDPFVLILSGQLELARTMDFAVMEPFAQRLALRYHVPPLGQEETAVYVTEHMKLAGAKEPIFSDDALGALYEVSFGIPRRVGTTAEQALTYAMFANERSVTADMVLRAKTGG
jgi:type II secretory pathway predicted ATPase ExeA